MALFYIYKVYKAVLRPWNGLLVILSKSTRFQCSTETVNSIDHRERVENLANGVDSAATNGPGFQASGALMDYNGFFGRAASSG